MDFSVEQFGKWFCSQMAMKQETKMLNENRIELIMLFKANQEALSQFIASASIFSSGEGKQS